MTGEPLAFPAPIYVTRPMLPSFEAYSARLASVWDSQFLTNGGAQHCALEAALNAYFAIPHVSLFNNGTIALLAGLRALGVSGEVITTPFTFPATIHAVAWNGMVPVFADIDPVTMNIDPVAVERQLTAKTSAILGVHVFGTPCDVHGLQAIADRHGLKVIYDAAHAFGTKVDGRHIAEFGDLTMLSFHATKLFHTAEGGALLVRDGDLKQKIEQLKNFGIVDEDEVAGIGLNGKMSEIHAALGLLTLDMVATEKTRRAAVARIYRSRLSALEGISFTPELTADAASQQYFAIRIDEERAGISRDRLHQELKRFNVVSRRYFNPLCSSYACYSDLPSSAPHLLPVAQRVVSEVLCLPFYGGLTADDAHRICDMIAWVAQH